MALDLSKVGERERLKAQREPHWQRLRAGCFLGFRPSKRGGKGTWIARAYDEDAGKYRLKALGDFGTLPGNEMFAAAKKEAERLADLVETGGEVRAKMETVADACREYAKTRPEAGHRFRRYVYADPIAKVKLDKLRRRHVKEWRERLEAQPALVSRRKEGEAIHRKRAASTVNRDMAVLRAALAKVLSSGAPNSEAAWQEALKAIPNANGRRTLYLDRSQRRKLVAKTDAEAAPFVRALCLLPLRPGALAGLTAGDFDKRTAELTIGKDKTGKPRRIQCQPRRQTCLRLRPRTSCRERRFSCAPTARHGTRKRGSTPSPLPWPLRSCRARRPHTRCGTARLPTSLALGCHCSPSHKSLAPAPK